MIDHVKKGDPLHLTAEAYNAMADAANAYSAAGAGAILAALRHATPGRPVMVKVGGGVSAGAAVRLTGPGVDLAQADRASAALGFAGALDWNAAQAGSAPIAIAAGSDAGGYVPAIVAGLAVVALTIGDAAHQYARPVASTTTGAVESAPAGPLRILAKSAATGAAFALCTVEQPAPAPANLYTIDRTATADDGKAWQPAANLPADWRDYDGLQLITGTIRLNGQTLEQVKVARQWPAALAPVVPALAAADVEAISDDFSCPEYA